MELHTANEKNKVRLDLLSAYTNNPMVLRELMHYTDNPFLASLEAKEHFFDLPDELHVADWKAYFAAARSTNALQVLKEPFVQLNFPVQEGMSRNHNYLQALYRGIQIDRMPEAQGLQLISPEKLRIVFVEGPAGTLPTLVVEHRQDFEWLLQSLFYKNEPKSIPAAMGASIIKRINNWTRFRKAVATYRSRHPFRSNRSIFTEIERNKALYQDTFTLISKKPYSNVLPENYSREDWLDLSVEIRKWHEYAHYFTWRCFGTMRNHMHDELLADYLGIHAIAPVFDARLFLQFVGLEDYPRYRNGGRLENYVGQPPMSAEAQKVLQTLVFKAAQQVESFDRSLGKCQDIRERFRRLLAIASLHLEEIAGPDGMDKLLYTYAMNNR